MPTKPWWQSKTVWAGVIGVLVVAYNAFREQLMPGAPVIPEWILGLLASIGVYGRVSATTKVA